MIDSHCHPQFPQYDQDRDEVIRRALDAGVQMICVGTDLENSRKAIDIASRSSRYDGPPSPNGFGRAGVWATVGLHPNNELDKIFDPEEYYHLGREPKVVGFGEIGLDYYRTPDTDQKNIQKRRFVQQIQVAVDLNLPLVIHCRDAYSEMLEILQRSKPILKNPPGVIHSFIGSWSEAKRFIDLGFYIGLNGIVSFSEQYADLARNLPLGRMLIETDAPFLAPAPYRGKRNEPLYVKYVAEKIAEIRGEPLEKIARATTDNCEKLFKINEKV